MYHRGMLRPHLLRPRPRPDLLPKALIAVLVALSATRIAACFTPDAPLDDPAPIAVGR